MKLTPEQFDKALTAYNQKSTFEMVNTFGLRAALESIELPDTLPTLQPIDKMPEKVPDGCLRISIARDGVGQWNGCVGKWIGAQWACDILLPAAPVDTNRAEFEAWATQTSPQRHLWDTFTPEERDWIFNAWNAAKKGVQA